MPTTLQSKLKAIILKARKSAKKLDLSIRDQDLFKLAKLVQTDQASHIRNISKLRAVFHIIYNNSPLYFVYNTKYKIADSFMNEKDARLNIRDRVWFIDDNNRKVSGIVVINVPAFETPKLEAFERGGFDLSKLPPTTRRPQRSYIIAADIDGGHYLLWPHLRILRKEYAKKTSKASSQRRSGPNRNTFRRTGSERRYPSR